MERQHDNNDKTPQIRESETGSGVADLLDCTPIGPREAAPPAESELTGRPMLPDISRGGLAIRRMGGSALASDGGGAALAWIIAARGFDHRESTVSDRLTEPGSLTQELIVAPRQER
jgi:hypothetical protein